MVVLVWVVLYFKRSSKATLCNKNEVRVNEATATSNNHMMHDSRETTRERKATRDALRQATTHWILSCCLARFSLKSAG